jgi:hypothetical protein
MGIDFREVPEKFGQALKAGGFKEWEKVMQKPSPAEKVIRRS